MSPEPYELYMGRWSRAVAGPFVRWLDVPVGSRWLDVGCGTGALTETVLALGSPSHVTGVDPSDGYVANARSGLRQAEFAVAEAASLPFTDATNDAVVSGLVLNFLPDPAEGLREMVRVAAPGAQVGSYVWDYQGEMQLLRRFWDAAVELDSEARELDEGRRFQICQPSPLEGLFKGAGLVEVEVHAMDIVTAFRDFEDYWAPFLGGQGPAPGYAMSLDEQRRTALRDRIRSRLPVDEHGSIRLTARAWAVRGRKQP